MQRGGHFLLYRRLGEGYDNLTQRTNHMVRFGLHFRTYCEAILKVAGWKKTWYDLVVSVQFFVLFEKQQFLENLPLLPGRILHNLSPLFLFDFLTSLLMYITWQGLTCVRLQTKDCTILVDPFAGTMGLSVPRLIADLFLFSDAENPQIAAVQKNKGFAITLPGEYESHGIVITGMAVNQGAGKEFRMTTVFTLAVEGMVVGLLGPVGRALDQGELEQLNGIDVLFVPVGGKPSLTAKQAVDLTSQIEPRVVIPYFFKLPGLKVPLDAVEQFAKEMGVKNVTPLEKLRLAKKELPEEDMITYILKPNTP